MHPCSFGSDRAESRGLPHRRCARRIGAAGRHVSGDPPAPPVRWVPAHLLATSELSLQEFHSISVGPERSLAETTDDCLQRRLCHPKPQSAVAEGYHSQCTPDTWPVHGSVATKQRVEYNDKISVGFRFPSLPLSCLRKPSRRTCLAPWTCLYPVAGVHHGSREHTLGG